MDNDLQEITNRIIQKAKSQKPTGQKSKVAGKFSPEELEKHGIYKRFENITFASIESKGLPRDEEIRKNYGIVKNYVTKLDENIEDGIGLILAGGYGTMKSTMAIAVLRYQVERGQGGLFVPMCSLIDNLFTMNRLSKEECARYEERIRKTPLLILDDLGSENTDQSWVLSKVNSIITERYNRQRPIIITTNIGKGKIADTYSGRILDRLRSTSHYLVFTGESQREAVS
jgi:DNA replication protein DnaC